MAKNKQHAKAHKTGHKAKPQRQGNHGTPQGTIPTLPHGLSMRAFARLRPVCPSQSPWALTCPKVRLSSTYSLGAEECISPPPSWFPQNLNWRLQKASLYFTGALVASRPLSYIWPNEKPEHNHEQETTHEAGEPETPTTTTKPRNKSKQGNTTLPSCCLCSGLLGFCCLTGSSPTRGGPQAVTATHHELLHPHVLILPRVPLAPRVLLLPLVLLDKLTEAVEDGGVAAVRCGRRHRLGAVQHNALQNFLHNIPLGPGRLVHAHPQTQCML